MEKVSIQTPTPFGIGDGTTKSFSVGGTGEVVDSMDVKSIYRADANGNNLLYQNVGPLTPGSYPQYPQGINNAICNRSTPATYIDQNGVLQTAGINVPRYQNGSLLVEAAATNLLKLTTNQSFIDTSTIYKSTSSLGNADGAVALTCVANGANRPFGSWGGVPVAAGAVVISSVWVESLSSAEMVSQILAWQGDFGSTRTWYLNGVALPGGNTLIGPFSFPVKLSCSLIGDVGGNPSLFVRSGIGCSSLTTAKQARISRPQLETGTVPTSYISTTTAPTTRAADQIVISDYTIS